MKKNHLLMLKKSSIISTAKERIFYMNYRIDEPKIIGVSLVADNTILLRIQQGEIIGGVQIPYIEEPGETLEVDKTFPELIYIKKNGKRIGIKVEDKQLGTRRFPLENVIGKKLDLDSADSTKTYQINGKTPLQVFRKTKPNNFADPYRGYTFLHSIYLISETSFIEGEEIELTFKKGIFDKEVIKIKFDPNTLMSEAIHVNQLGYRPDDYAKKAYLSQWMGLGKGISYDNIKHFYLINNKNEIVFTGDVIFNHKGDIIPLGGQEISSLCPVYEMDFSSFNLEGEYKVLVKELGCSFPFTINKEIWKNGFLASMNAIYCQRSGIVTGKPYSKFERPRCYHPDDGKVIYQSKCSLFASGNGLNCYGSDVNNFGNLVRMATDEVVENAWGGYFDACDWDRRVHHLKASKLHIELFLMFPNYFTELKLSIPESGNEYPDILNEAMFNLDFYKRLQLSDGGIRGGVEQEEHPIWGQCGWQDTLKSYAYAPDFWSSYIYASTSARMAYALMQVDPKKAEEYKISAEKAFDYAERTYAEGLIKEGHKWRRKAHNGVKTERENAACDLFRLTHDNKYEKIYLEVRSKGNHDANFVYATLPDGIGDEQIKLKCKQAIIDAAEETVKNGNSLPYHLTSENLASDKGNGYGAFTTIPRNTQLIRAHYLTGNEKYLQTAISAADFALGANPDNICFTTGVGVRYPKNILHHDSRMTGQEAPVGITVFGPQDFNHPDSIFPSLIKDDFLWPGAYVWPTFEGYLDIYRHPCSTEYTVHGTLGPNNYQWGYFAARRIK
jgi:endoglucanase